MGDQFWAFVPIAAILGFWFYLVSRSQANARVRELQIRERIALIEKGLVPPPEVDPRGFDRALRRDEHWPRRTSSHRHRSAGVTLIGVGLGLILMIAFAGEDPEKAVGIGGFIVMLGLAFLVNSLFEQRRVESEASRTSDEALPLSPSATNGSTPSSQS